MPRLSRNPKKDYFCTYFIKAMINLRTAPVIGFLILSPIEGLLSTLVSSDFSVLFFPLLAAFCCVTWCGIDSHHRGIRLSKWFVVGLFFLALIFLPIYLFHSRGLRGFLGIGIAIIVLAAATLLSIAGEEFGFWLTT